MSLSSTSKNPVTSDRSKRGLHSVNHVPQKPSSLKTPSGTSRGSHLSSNHSSGVKPSRHLQQGSSSDRKNRPRLIQHQHHTISRHHDCPQCHTPQSQFYCQTCLSERLQAHYSGIDRVSRDRDRAYSRAARLLGQPVDAKHLLQLTGSPPGTHQQTLKGIVEGVQSECPAQPLPDPFQDPSSLDNSSLDAFKVEGDSPIAVTPSGSSHLQSPPPDLGLRRLIHLRSCRISLMSSIQASQSCTAELYLEIQSAEELIREKKANIKRRKENLELAWETFSLLAGGKESRRDDFRRADKEQESKIRDEWSPQKGPGAWPGDDIHVQTEVCEGKYWSAAVGVGETSPSSPLASPDSITDGSNKGSAPSVPLDGSRMDQLVNRVKDDVASLEAENKNVAEELRKTRAILAKEAFSIFAVSPPPGFPSKSFPVNTGISSGLTSPTRSNRFRDRYMPGAFDVRQDYGAPSAKAQDFDQHGRRFPSPGDAAGSHTAGKDVGTNPNDWTIVGLVLPLPGDVRRFPRDSINGALAHTVHLLQLLTAYLGISLPFTIGVQGGKTNIRPNSLWAGGGGSSKQALHLSSAAYAVLSSPPPGANSSSKLGESIFSLGLGASTLSTLESFIQLPPGSHFSWGSTSNMASAGKGTDPQGAKTKEDGNGREDSASETAPPSKSSKQEKVDPGVAEAKAFCSALVMLGYNVAYLASTQGVKADLVSAAGSSLRLLSRAIQSPELGKKAHTTYAAGSQIVDISFPELDVDQLAQIHEPATTGGLSPTTSSTTSGKNPSSSGKSSKSSSSGKGAKETKIVMEGSYVDAAAAAASVLDISRGSSKTEKGAAKVGTIAAVTHIAAAIPSVPSSTSTRSSEGANLGKKAQRATLDRKSESRSSSSSSSTTTPSKTSPTEKSNLAPTRQSSKVIDHHGTTGRKLPKPSPASLEFLRKRGLDVSGAATAPSKSPLGQAEEYGKGGGGGGTNRTGDGPMPDVGEIRRTSGAIGSTSRVATHSKDRGRITSGGKVPISKSSQGGGGGGRPGAGAVIFNGVEIGGATDIGGGGKEKDDGKSVVTIRDGVQRTGDGGGVSVLRSSEKEEEWDLV
ncbi:hypothetical protein IE53DRAFT_384966 [Violaceomyces palustris]|uniref:Uncharacterized protein n=1 Tax=Violaceomyces palustris TaxID=1673888 RepID=A0ACD0P3G2_9BASI|nr:hypothetical protein IE53DRAFT_384966 [Violaceomyces palustris]